MGKGKDGMMTMMTGYHRLLYITRLGTMEFAGFTMLLMIVVVAFLLRYSNST